MATTTLRSLRNSTAASWRIAVNTAGIADCGERYDARREQAAAEARDSALANWDAGIAAVARGDWHAAIDELEQARELAAEWGDDSPEIKALELLKGLPA